MYMKANIIETLPTISISIWTRVLVKLVDEYWLWKLHYLLYTRPRMPQLLNILALSKSQVQSLCSGVMMSGWLEISTTQMYLQSATHELCKYVLNANGRCPYDSLTSVSLCWRGRLLYYFMDRNIWWIILIWQKIILKMENTFRLCAQATPRTDKYLFLSGLWISNCQEILFG